MIVGMGQGTPCIFQGETPGNQTQLVTTQLPVSLSGEVVD